MIGDYGAIQYVHLANPDLAGDLRDAKALIEEIRDSEQFSIDALELINEALNQFNHDPKDAIRTVLVGVLDPKFTAYQDVEVNRTSYEIMLNWEDELLDALFDLFNGDEAAAIEYRDSV